MNAATTTYSRLSFRSTVTSVVAAALLATLCACGKNTDAAAGAGSSTVTGAAAPAAPAAGKKPKATLKIADYRAAYKSQMDDLSKMKDPMDKKVAAVVAKLGAPAADTGRKKTWYALDGDKCIKVDIDTKDGSSTEQGTDKSDCGM